MLKDIDTIEKYLSGQMSEDEENEFKEIMDDDEEFKEEVFTTALMIKCLKEEERKSDEAIIEEIKNYKPVKKQHLKSVKYWIGSIAALFVLIFGGIQYWGGSKINQTFENNYTVSEYSSTASRGGDGDTEKELTTLFNSIGTTDNIDDCIKQLESIYSQADDNYDYATRKDDIAWYLSLAYLKDHRLDDARKTLQTLINEAEDDDYKQKASRLYEEIKDIHILW